MEFKELYTPSTLGKSLSLVDGEWIGHFEEYVLKSAFQPILSKSLDAIIGYEGLLRVTKNALSISPLVFLSRFEKKTEIANICGLCASLHLRNFSLAQLKGKIFLNAHPTMFARISNNSSAIDHAIRRIHLEGLKPENVVWEVTEFKESDEAHLLQGLSAFKRSGTKIAVDDYGQMASNDARINLLKPDIIKIDRSLILDFCHNNNPFLISLTNSLYSQGVEIALEGIETQKEHNLLQAIPHNFVQGYFYEKPVEMKNILRAE